jgi:hypothetical protein
MDAFIVLGGLVVAVGTPVGTYIAARKGHAAAERVATIGADTARGAAIAAASTAEAGDQTIRREQGRNHFRWASEKAWSSDPTVREGGIAVLRSMLEDDKLSHDDLVAVVGVLSALTADAVNRVGEPAA